MTGLAPGVPEEAPATRGRRSQIDQPERYPYQPALDGVRALAVTGVVLYHFGVGALGGGFLGVDIFLALSGFLITTLLLREFVSTRRVSIGAFYGRRARRLLPGLMALLAVVALYGHYAADQIQLVKLRGDTLASLFYVANWRFVFEGTSYFQQFAQPSPVSHLWSLAIEEQWYLVWPLVVMGLLLVLGPPVGRRRSFWVGLVTAFAAVSALLMALLVDNANVNRVYYGTDTRAQTLLVGAALAVVFHGRSFSRRAQKQLDIAGIVGLFACIAMLGLVDAADTWMYRGGFALFAVCAALLVAGAAGPTRGVTRGLLSLPPLPELGQISYGVYLWHWPVAVFLGEHRTGLSGASLFIIRVAVTLLISIASFELVERPIRQRALPTRQGAIAAVAALAATATLLITIIPVRSSPEDLLAAAQPQAGATAGGLKVLVAGDSVALTLAWNWAGALGRGARLDAAAVTIGCGVAVDQPKCAGVFQKWRKAVSAFSPDVTVLVLGRWELYDRVIRGHRLKFRSRADEQFLLKRLEEGLSILGSRGGRVALLSVPCFGLHPPAPHQSAGDIQWLNGLFRKAAANAGPAVHVVDYANFVCPGGQDRQEIGGVRLRPDGTHLTREGAGLVWEWLAPQLLWRSTAAAR